MPWNTIWLNDGSAQGDLVHDTPVGSFSYDGRINVSIAAGVNAAWDASYELSPVAYKVIPAYGDKIVRFTAILSGFSASAPHARAGIVLWSDRNNAFSCHDVYDPPHSASGFKLVAGAYSALFSAVGIGDANLDPLYQRFVYDPVTGVVEAWAKGAGLISWTLLFQGAAPVAFTRFGVFGGNWIPSPPSLDASWDEMRIETLDPPPAYRQGAQDTDGNSLVRGSEVLDALVVDTTVGSFGSPTTKAHTGFARDGKAYIGGAECTPGYSLGDTRSWRDNHHDPWANFQPPSATSPSLTYLSGEAILSCAASPSGWKNVGAIVSNPIMVLRGDFDIEVGFHGNTFSGSDYTLDLYAVRNQGGIEGSNNCRMSMSNNGFYCEYFTNGSVGGHISGTGTPYTSGGLRLVRTGTSVQAWYKAGAGAWTLRTTWASNPISNKDVFIRLSVDTNSRPGTVYFSTPVLNSGTVVSPFGWADEAFGPHCGSRGDMPESMLVVATANSVDLLDFGSERLWRRFVLGGNGYALFNNGGSRPRKLSWRNGQLLVAHGSDESIAAEGGLVTVDFTRDLIYLQRAAASTATGATFRGSATNYYVERTGGNIVLRNASYSSFGYAGDDASLAIPNYRVLGNAVSGQDPYQYRAAGTSGGLAITRISSINLGLGASTATSVSTDPARHVMFDDAYGIRWITDTDLNYASAATWQAGLGGTFAADSSIPLAGTRTQPQQFRFAAGATGDIWLPGDEGLYRSQAGGPFQLEYGGVGSGAIHELLLPGYDRVSAVSIRQVGGGVEHLVFGLTRTAEGIQQTTLIALVPGETVFASADVGTTLDFSELVAVG